MQNINDLIGWYLVRYPHKQLELLELNHEIIHDTLEYDPNRLEDIIQDIVNPEIEESPDPIDWASFI
jgi:hypothetical protein